MSSDGIDWEAEARGLRKMLDRRDAEIERLRAIIRSAIDECDSETQWPAAQRQRVLAALEAEREVQP
jgi:hypothetical protein